MDRVVPDDLMQERLRECAEVQDPIAQAARDALVGDELEVLVDGTDDESGEPVGRSHREAPEIDGVVRITGEFARPGARVRARVTSACGPDLVAEPV
jgi:ribosomal protein S12 methylthiotransferase